MLSIMCTSLRVILTPLICIILFVSFFLLWLLHYSMFSIMCTILLVWAWLGKCFFSSSPEIFQLDFGQWIYQSFRGFRACWSHLRWRWLPCRQGWWLICWKVSVWIVNWWDNSWSSKRSWVPFQHSVSWSFGLALIGCCIPLIRLPIFGSCTGRVIRIRYQFRRQ